MSEFDHLTGWLRAYAQENTDDTVVDRWFAYLKAIETVTKELHSPYPTPYPLRDDATIRRAAEEAAATGKLPEIAIADLLEGLNREGL